MTTAAGRHPATRELASDREVMIGTSWYPELWPEAEWELDLAKMVEAGIRLVRIFEFAWHRAEPRDGVFELDWAVRVLDRCHAHGIQVMVGTPTAAPPAWLTSAWPEVLKTSAGGVRDIHGQRRHGSHIAAKYREFCVRIARAFALAFTGHPALAAWQIDNEMSGFDYGPEARRRFHAWLERTYGTVAEMNRAWSLDLWSQVYDRFDQVPLVLASVGSIEVPERNHPSLILAIARFQNEEWSAYIADQCAAIRAVAEERGVAPKAITTNMTGTFQMDWKSHNAVLDRVGHSMYSDLDHYPWLVYRHDRTRIEKRGPDGLPAPYWLLETAPNWSGGGRIWNIHHDAAGLRMNSWLATALGATATVYWQWREHPAGQEMLHGTFVTAQGAWRPNLAAWQRLSGEYAKVGSWLLEHPPAPAGLGLLFSAENAWGWSIDPISDHFTYVNAFRDEVHAPLAAAHWWRDVVEPGDDLSRYRMLIAPWLAILRPAVREQLAAFVKGGGRLLLGPGTGFRTSEWTVHRDRVFGGLETLIGGESSSRFSPMWVEDRIRVRFTDGRESKPKQWCEAFAPTTGEAMASYVGGYGDGQAAAIRHQFGAGEVITLGCPVDQPTWLHLVKDLAAQTGLTPAATGSPHVLVAPRADRTGKHAGWVVVNLKESEQSITLPGSGTDLLTGQPVTAALSLEPCAVRVIVAD